MKSEDADNILGAPFRSFMIVAGSQQARGWACLEAKL